MSHSRGKRDRSTIISVVTLCMALFSFHAALPPIQAGGAGDADFLGSLASALGIGETGKGEKG
jgi:hypothetical protein